jgi:hypothetical protein
MMNRRESPSTPSLKRNRWINRTTSVLLWSHPSDLIKWRSDGGQTIGPLYALAPDPYTSLLHACSFVYPYLIIAVVLIQWRARGYERSRLIFPEEDQMVVKRDHAVCASHPIQAYMFQIFFYFCVGLWAFWAFLLHWTPLLF